MIYKCFIIFLFSVSCFISTAQDFEIKSPNGQIAIQVNSSDNISWSAKLNGASVVEKSIVNMVFSEGASFGVEPKLKSHTIKSLSSMIYPIIPHKNAEIKDDYTELSLRFKGNYKLNFRVYNDGVAYQFLDDSKGERQVISEQMDLTFPEGTTSLFPLEASMYSHNECYYFDKAVIDIPSEEFCSLPVLFKTDKTNILFTETALHDYPGLFLKGNSNTTLSTQFPKYVLETVAQNGNSDRNQTITKEADYIAKTSGNRAFPWRVFVITNDDSKLVESDLSFKLAKPNTLKNTDWIKPGKVAWDWYNANNIYGVNFKSGLNPATYKYYIDFASRNNIEYVILDEGWTKSTTDILHVNPDMDVEELISYGAEKGVGIILWVLWKPLDENQTEILETYKKWGAKGIKIDFMQRNDQYMVSSYEKIAKQCAELELLVDYHGAFKPSGLRRAYPNILNYEGVRGNENNKWSKENSPEHNVTLPFIRMVAGPLDYTPGAMNNAQEANHAISFARPISLGTRAHQVAMYIVYEAPLQMLCESPSRYYEEQETVDFITQIPTTWDETKALQASVGNFIAIARKKDDTWYIGAMTDWDERTLELDLFFLDEGDYRMEIFKDGINANTFAEDYRIETIDVNKDSEIDAKMAKGGGWAAIITKI